MADTSKYLSFLMELLKERKESSGPLSIHLHLNDAPKEGQIVRPDIRPHVS